MNWKISYLIACCCCLASSESSHAQVDVPSDGSDGVFHPMSDVSVDLSRAITGAWDAPGGDVDGDGLGNGVYDPDRWAVVFKFSDVVIPSDVTVLFTNHSSGAPVVWLVDGDVTVNGTISVDGGHGHGASHPRRFSTPGPGGFAGGRASNAETNAGGGRGPGGGDVGNRGGGGGSYGDQGSGASGPAYGNVGVFPLVGGSGGAGGRPGTSTCGGGAGGGAILIACSGVFELGGEIRANGGGGGCGSWRTGGGGGSGGAIRLTADSITGTGHLQALRGYGTGNYAPNGGHGGVGRIRIEANVDALVHDADPMYSFGTPGDTARIWPDDFAPIVRNVSIAGQQIPSGPLVGLTYPNTDVSFIDGQGLELIIETENIPPATGRVTVRAVRLHGPAYTIDAEYQSGDEFLSTWSATLDLSVGYSVIQVRAEIE